MIFHTYIYGGICTYIHALYWPTYSIHICPHSRDIIQYYQCMFYMYYRLLLPIACACVTLVMRSSPHTALDITHPHVHSSRTHPHLHIRVCPSVRARMDTQKKNAGYIYIFGYSNTYLHLCILMVINVWEWCYCCYSVWLIEIRLMWKWYFCCYDVWLNKV